MTQNEIEASSVLVSPSIPVKVFSKSRAVPIKRENNKITLATTYENSNIYVYFREYFPGCEFELVKILPDKLDEIIKYLFLEEELKELISKVKIESESYKTEKSNFVLKLLELILKRAVEKKASDIHFEAFETKAKIKFRLLGSLYEFVSFDMSVFESLVSRIKLSASMNVSEKRRPQDGSFSIKIEKREYDLRVSSLPTIWGESVVIRILNKTDVSTKLSKIGFSKELLYGVKKILNKSYGLFLSSGPTGSGKSTTLYACLKELCQIENKIITVEDPVEYKLENVQQVQVNEKIGLGFADILKNILRQDPDIIMIGEIRDLKTLQIALKAAFSGHLVLSTIHANDALGAIDRMVNLGIEPFMLSAVLAGVQSQRLIRINCPFCKERYLPKENYLELISDKITSDTRFYKSRGCIKCDMSGFYKREVIGEIFLNDENMEKLIIKGNRADIKTYLKKINFKSIFEDGLVKVFEGKTTLEELIKVVNI